MIDALTTKWNSRRICQQILKTPINQTTKRRCASPEDSDSTIKKLFDLPGLFDRFYQRLNKEDDNRHICQSPPLDNELLHSTIDDSGINLLFCIFPVLKNA